MTELGPDLMAKVRRQHRTVVQQVLWIFLALLLLTILVSLLVFGVHLQSLAANAFLGAIVGAALWLNHRGSLEIALGLVIGTVIFAACLPLVIYGLRGTQASWFLFFIPVVLAALLLSRRALFLTGGVSLLALALGYVLERTGLALAEAPMAIPDPGPLAMQAGIVLLIVMFFLDRFGLSLYRALVTAAERESQLVEEIAERRAAEERLGLALSAANMATYDMVLSSSEVYGSANLESLYDLPYTGRARPLQDYVERMHPEDRVRARQTTEAHQRAPMEHQAEYRVLREDGSVRWLATTSKTVSAEAGSAERIIGIVTDVTETKVMQSALQEANETLEQRVRERTQQVQALAGELTLAEAREQARLAQVLHDDLQQQLYAIQFALRELRQKLSGDSEALEQLEDVSTMLKDAVVTARGTTANLSPPVLRGEGLVEALLWLSSDMRERHGLTIKINAAEGLKIPNDSVRVMLFGLIRELLFNVVKHAEVHEASVELEQSEQRLSISVCDAGKGFAPDVLEQRQSGTGLGLASARKRLELFGGSLTLSSSAEEGTRVTVTLPASVLTLAQ